MPTPEALAPISASPPRPIAIDEEETFVVKRAVSVSRCERVARAAILEALLGPLDIDPASVLPAVLVQVPFWRVHVSRAGWHVGVPSATGADRRVQIVDRKRRDDAVLLVPARRDFEYVPHSQAFSSAALGGVVLRAFEIPLTEMVPARREPPDEGEVVVPDVTRAEAEEEALSEMTSLLGGASAIEPRLRPAVRSAALCFYPLVVVRYAHEGAAYHVIVSARTGGIVGARRPPRLPGIAARLRRAIDFGR